MRLAARCRADQGMALQSVVLCNASRDSSQGTGRRWDCTRTLIPRCLAEYGAARVFDQLYFCKCLFQAVMPTLIFEA